jgi:type IV pilus assembly protein PilP
MMRNKSILLFVATLNLAGCERDVSDFQQYIASIKARPKQPVKPLPEFQTVEPFVYKKTEGMRDPFKPVEKVEEPEEIENTEEPDNGIHPDKNRKKEPLEGFSLSGMRMVGSVQMNSQLWGLLRNENTIYRVKVGDYLGEHDGRITHIDKNKIELLEIVPDKKPGRFIEQAATLVLAE